MIRDRWYLFRSRFHGDEAWLFICGTGAIAASFAMLIVGWMGAA